MAAHFSAIRVAARAFVYGTEDESRVAEALLDCLGLPPVPPSRSRITRSRTKGHFGAEILNLEAVVKNAKELRGFAERLTREPALLARLEHEFAARLDEDNVMHFRLRKQEAVQGRLELGEGGDTVSVEVKYAPHGPHATFPLAAPRPAASRGPS